MSPAFYFLPCEAGGMESAWWRPEERLTTLVKAAGLGSVSPLLAVSSSPWRGGGAR